MEIQIPDVSQLGALEYPNVVSVRGLNTATTQSMEPLRLRGATWSVFQLELIRRFESALVTLDRDGLLHGPLHSSIGQEAVAVGIALGLGREDRLTASHRAHHHFLAKGVRAVVGQRDDEPDLYRGDRSIRQFVRRTMAEILGLEPGFAGGRGGSMHLIDPETGNWGTQAIVAGNMPYSAGLAFADKARNSGLVTVAVIGDGGISIGPFFEALSISAAYRLPIVFLIENNLYAVATDPYEVTGLNELVLRASGHGVPGLIVDGMDPLSVVTGVQAARQYAVDKGPAVIEAKTYRYLHQSGGWPGSAFGYRTKEEEEKWANQDPLLTWPEFAISAGLVTRADVESARKAAAEYVDDAVAYVTRPTDDDTIELKSELWPSVDTLRAHLVNDGRELDGLRWLEVEECAATTDGTMIEAISIAIARALEVWPEAFVLGEDVANLGGGAYGATRQALSIDPSRVHNAPIAEGGIVGIAHGAAAAGMRPIAEIMFSDFNLVAADELFNQVANFRYMYNGQASAPLVLRSRCSAGRGFGAQHSGDLVGLFAMYPGWRIVAPSTPFDYMGLFNTAMHSDDPVLVLEHHSLHAMKGPLPADDMDYAIPFGKAKVVREGDDLTVITYLSMVPRLQRIAGEIQSSHGMSIEVIDLRSLDYQSIDVQTVRSSARRTGAVAIVEESPTERGLGGFVANLINGLCGDEMRRSAKTLGSLPFPMPVSRPLEEHILINDEDIRTALVGMRS